ncbi:FMN-binding negative transcriptional regulator [Massilia sp. TSP1-1-2]|uniref:FMN-binding negative transcriptional regulator n=1 Tax=unclassified Massilia TaxID=2609279 RepID=UPI003CF343E9
MYSPPPFDETRPALLQQLIAQHPLGTVIVNGADGLAADHIPFELGPATLDAPLGVLRAHVARANPLWRHDGETMVVFQGPSAYVSPSLYEEKQVSGKVVPTWNYAVVHAHGRLRAVEDAQWLLALLERMTATHEAARAAPWTVDQAPRAWIDKIMQAIVGIEIPVSRMQGKWKMSQNRTPQDQAMVAADTGLALYRRA